MSRVTSLRGQNTMPLQALLDRPVAYHCAFVKLGVGATGALMLSQAVYWSSRTNDADGWFYKSQVEWEAETGLTRYEQEGARKKLVKLGVMEEKKQGLPCKLFYRVALDFLVATLDGENQQASLGKTTKQACGEPASQHGENQHAITETTTETTTDSAQASAVADIFEASAYRPMTLGWKPDMKTLKAYAFGQGVNVAAITTDMIASFSCHHSAHPEVCDTAAGWTNKLVGWAKRERVRGESTQDAASVPAQGVVDLYHQHCPAMAVVTVLDAKIRGLLAERWAEHAVHQDLAFWADYFTEASRIAEVFYRGQKRAPFLEALLSRDVFRDVMEGRANA
ncbi:DnaT-like ssDNA-binding domain-containing protein [Pseudomonas gorinensis]